MTSMKIIMAVLIAACAVFYVMYLWDFALVLLVIMIALPVIMFLTVLYARFNIKISFHVNGDNAVKNQQFPVQLIIENNGLIPVGKADAEIEYYNTFNNEINSFNMFFPIQSKNAQSVSFSICSKFCGIVNVGCAYVRIYDPLRIFSFKIAKKLHTEIAVMPEGQEISGDICFTDRINEDSQNFSEYKPGDDPSEVFDLRGYNPGDRLNRIHWKLSSKKDEFIVKDYSLPVDIPSSVFLNLRCYEDSKYTLPVFDTLVEALVSVSKFMLEHERSHTVIYYDEKKKQYTEREVYNFESLSECVRELICSITDNLHCELPETYFTENEGISLSSFTFITSMPDTDILTKIDDETDADIKNALVIVKYPEEASDMTDRYTELNVIPVVMGRISTCVKDILL